jgi:uncharacterized membrane protein
MAENSSLVLYTAEYDNVASAQKDLDTIEQLHDDEMIGSYDAAVIAKENGKPRIVKRIDHPRIRIIPEELGGGKLPRKELTEAAGELTANQAGLIVVGKPTIEKGFDRAVQGAARVVKRSLDATTDEVADELQEALKS